MRYDAQHRIMSLSFERDPNEHAEIMLAAERRFMRGGARRLTPATIGIFVLCGAGFGLAMELYRRYVLSLVWDISTIPPFNIVIMQVLPLFALLWMGFVWRNRSMAQKAAASFQARLDRKLFVDTDIYAEGLRCTSGPIHIQINWNAIRDITITAQRIEFEGEATMLYLPFRAFESRADFNLRAKELQALWRAAKRKIDPKPFKIVA